ncbi:MAG: VOC family protein [Saprospiraceae bacterium]|nr:VOC family protein [Saprospiraceae bacterium]
MHDFKINSLDHVAIRVADIERSAKWYHEVLGLTIIRKEEWDPFPIMLFKGKTGIALFPAKMDDPPVGYIQNIKIDHFAFNVDFEEYDKALKYFKQLGIPIKEQDHYYFQSVYLTDPDGHTVELTALKPGFEDFYNPQE